VLWTWRTRVPEGRGSTLPGARGRLPRTAAAAALAAIVAGAAACGASGAGPAAGTADVTRSPASPVSVLRGAPDVVAAAAAGALFADAPVVVVADASRRLDVEAGAIDAQRAHAPLLLTALPGASVSTTAQTSAAVPGRRASRAASLSAAVRTQIGALHATEVLAVGVSTSTLSAQLPAAKVVTDPRSLTAVRPGTPLGHVAVLVNSGATGVAAIAAAATARAAGAELIVVRDFDPRVDPTAITELASTRPARVIAIGAGFGTAALLAGRVRVAETGVQLPGGGQVLFPYRRLVALYGYPGNPVLGALGHQDLTASIARVRALARLYQPLSGVRVVPTFEIIATVAEGSPGPDGSYSYETPVAVLRQWVSQATAAGLYVVLDLQAGRANLLAQAMHYRSLLSLPDVGLALDPEWKLQPGQQPLRQIGSISSAQVNAVANWLALLTARNHLPQKLLVLHQFELSMIGAEARLDTRHDDLAIVIHMDGQGTPADKQQTWKAIIGAAPKGVFFGWKNFFVKDHPMLTPKQTMARTPKPVMISYQ
jgi:hypothetical protein